MRWLRSGYFVLAALFLLGVVVQFFLAGLGVFGADDFDPHRLLGFILIFVGLVMLVLGILARLPRATLLLTLLVAALAVLQMFLANADDVVAAFHVVNALALFVVAHALVRRAGPYVRSKSAA